MLKLENAIAKKLLSSVIDRQTYRGLEFPFLKTFESALSKQLGGIFTYGISDYTSALVLALKALKIGPGDEVILPAFGYSTILSSIVLAGAVPVFVDIEGDHFAIDIYKIEEKITGKTKAVVISHLLGYPTPKIRSILEIAHLRSISVVEDGWESLGAETKVDGRWKISGTMGDIVCFNFSPTSSVASVGTAAAIVFANPDLSDRIDQLRFYGAKKHYYDYPIVGVNAKLHETQAAILLSRLQFLNYWLAYRQEIAKCYIEHLNGIGDIMFTRESPTVKRAWNFFNIQATRKTELEQYIDSHIKSWSGISRNENYFYKPAFLPLRYPGEEPSNYPIALGISAEFVSLPITHSTSLQDVKALCENIKKFLTEA